ncbi:MAG TPA: hypothetical protein VER96_29685 [Polyangiaceae bacterium]|nr:hypothetical protein [Polyangiaceae bacterium]
MRPLLGSLPVALIALFARAVAAEEPSVGESAALNWQRLAGAESCPSEAEVTQAIEQRLGHAALVPKAQATLLIEARLEGVSSGGFRVEIALIRGDAVEGRRELDSEEPSCQSVAETAALVIALTIDPEASLEPLAIRTAEPAPPKPVPPAPPRATPSDAPAPAKSPVTRAPWQADLELGGGIALGTIPEVAPGMFLRGRALPPKLPLGIELEGAYFPAQQVEAAPGKGSDFRTFYVGTGVCSRPKRASRFGASACGGAQVGAISGQGYGFQSTTTFGALTVALAARGALWYRFVTPFALVLGSTVAVPLKRDYFETETADGTQPLFRMSAVGLGFNLGVVLEL